MKQALRTGIVFRPSFVKPPAAQKQAVSTWPAAALVVSNMIGIGVFTSLGFQIKGFSHDGVSDLTGSVFPLIMLWVVGGVLALCGALCYAELATALPRSGGEYNFLSRIYHPMVGFCTGLTSATIGFAAPIAVSALAFGEYFCRAFPAVAHFVPNNTEHAVAFLLVCVATAAHLRSLRFTGVFQAAATGMTVLLILAFIGFGFSNAPAQPVTFVPHAADWNLPVFKAFGASLIWVMYSYSGWNAAAYIVEEVRNPAKALPRALMLGVLRHHALRRGERGVPLLDAAGRFSGRPKFEVAHISGTQIFGTVGARITGGADLRGAPASPASSGMMWVGSRVTEAIGATPTRPLGLFGHDETSKTRVPYVAFGSTNSPSSSACCFSSRTV